MNTLHLALALTALLLAVLMTLGAGLQFGVWRTAKTWHHALYFVVVVCALASALLAYRAAQPWPALLPALGLLLAMPRTKAGTRPHWALALACAGALSVGMWAVW